MRECPTAALLHRQPGLRPVQRLNVTLLVHTQHDGLLGRIHVQPHDVRQLLHERGIGRQLERLHSMGLEAMRVPDPLHGRATDPLRLRHRATTPGGRPRWRAVQRCVDDGFDPARTDRRFAPAPLTHLEHRINALLSKPVAPSQHGRPADVHGHGNAAVGNPLGRQQQRLRADDYPMRCRRTTGPLFQESPTLRGHGQSGGGIIHPADIARRSLICKCISGTLH